LGKLSITKWVFEKHRNCIMKIYTTFTSSHKILFDEHFLPSYKKVNKNKKFSLYVSEMEQISRNGSYSTYGFRESTSDKLKVIIKAISDNMGEWIIFSDPDVQLFEGFEDDVLKYSDKNVDIYCQCDTPKCPENVILCTGFMIINCNDNIKKIFESSLTYINNFEHDQYAFNYFVRTNRINFKTLPEDQYYTIAYNTGNVVWNGETYNDIPKNILMHHANWTAGIDNKIKLLKYIKDEIAGKVII
jgi:hypothetical protein